MSADLQIKTDKLAEDLVEQCSMPERDLECINGIIQHVKAVSTPLKPARSQYLNHDWRLVFATDNDAISAVGTGLHTLPLTRMQVKYLYVLLMFLVAYAGEYLGVETAVYTLHSPPSARGHPSRLSFGTWRALT